MRSSSGCESPASNHLRRKENSSMSKTKYPHIAIVTVLLLIAVGALHAAEIAKPNVLLIILDDQNAFAGRTDLAAEAVTPNLDRFAKNGVIFSNAQCAAPVCNPSRTALLSGLRPSTTGIYDNSQD